MKTIFNSIFIFLLLLMFRPVWGLEEDDIPQRVSVLPVFFVARGEVPPRTAQIDMLMKHLKLAQQRYKEMLKRRDTFVIAEKGPQVFHYRFPLATLKKRAGKKLTPYVLQTLFKEYKLNRFNCPYVFLVLIMNPKEAWPTASGRPFNGGFNGGGGIVFLTSNKLDEKPCLIQGSIQHELNFRRKEFSIVRLRDSSRG